MVCEECIELYDFFSSKSTFEESIYHYIKTKCGEIIKQTVLVFPRSVTTEQRHKLHTFSSNGAHFKSYGNVPDRVIRIVLSYDYLVKIFQKYKDNEQDYVYEQLVKNAKERLYQELYQEIKHKVIAEYKESNKYV